MKTDLRLQEALSALPAKPGDGAPQQEKKRYSERVSEAAAYALAEDLRTRGLAGTRPGAPGGTGDGGAERRMAGGLGAKKVDVTWATEESGLLLAISVKTINFRDTRTGNFQKNLTNRRGDMLMEAMTLHRRFPYAVLGGLFFFDKDAERDGTDHRRSTFQNAPQRLRLFTNRQDPAGREEQFERFYLLLLDAGSAPPEVRAYAVGEPDQPLTLTRVVDDLLELVAQRNPDFYEFEDGRLRRAS